MNKTKLLAASQRYRSTSSFETSVEEFTNEVKLFEITRKASFNSVVKISGTTSYTFSNKFATNILFVGANKVAMSIILGTVKNLVTACCFKEEILMSNKNICFAKSSSSRLG